MEPAATHAGHAIRDRRQDLGLKQSEAADLAGVSRATWMRAEQGDKPLTGATIGAVMAALGWTRNSYQQLLAGEDPSPLTGELSDRRRFDAMEARLDALAKQVDEFTDVRDELADIKATLRTLLNLGD